MKGEKSMKTEKKMNNYEKGLRKDIKKWSKKIALNRLALCCVNGYEALSVLGIITGAVGLILSTSPIVCAAMFFLGFFARRYYSTQEKELKKELERKLVERDKFKEELERYEERSRKIFVSPKVKASSEKTIDKENTDTEEKTNLKESITPHEISARKIGNYQVHSTPSTQKPLFQDSYNQTTKRNHEKLTCNQEKLLTDAYQQILQRQYALNQLKNIKTIEEPQKKKTVTGNQKTLHR